MLQEVEITEMVFGGDGIGRLADGRAVFIPFVLPGERVQVELVEEKRGHARGRLVKLLRPSGTRIEPRCAHFGVCGGCHYQHIPYDLQLQYKKAIFIEQLQRIAGIASPIVEQIIPSAEMWHYRNTVQFQVSEQGKLCYAGARENALFPVRECHLPMPAVNDFWPQMIFEAGSYSGRLEIRQNNEGELLVELEGGESGIPELENESSVSIVSLSGDDAVVLAGDDHLVMQVNEKPFVVSAGSFFQTNFSGAGALVDEVRAMVKECNPRRMLDVYCGAGLFSAFLAGEVAELAGIEASASACRDFAINLDEYDNVSLYQGAAEHVLPALDFKADGVILDPPRGGLRPEARRALVMHKAHAIVYVSCNPATLARDAKHLLEAGYNLQKSILVDMFPQTFHVESVNLFTRD